VLAFLALAMLAACGSVSTRTRESTPAPPPPPSFATVTATPPARPHDEIAALRGYSLHPGARLRIAYLLQSTGDFTAAESELVQVIFADPPPSASTEAIARWLRARGFEHRRDDARAQSERAQARQLTTDALLIAAIDGPSPAPREDRGTVALQVQPRDSWRAAAAKTAKMKRMGKVTRITIHHSATTCVDDRPGTAIAAIRSIQRYHQQEQGWGDIGYHYLIDRAGRVWTGRQDSWQGAHAGDDERNRGNLGICLLGNFLPRDDGAPPKAQLEALERLVAATVERHGLSPKAVVSHADLKETDCPGPYVETALTAIRGKLNRTAALAGGRAASSPE
jgi:hypothetical protein